MYVNATVLLSLYVVRYVESIVINAVLFWVIVLFIISIVLNRLQPIIIILRRFNDSSNDVILTDLFLPNVSRYGRIVWLGSKYSKELLAFKRYTPLALVCQLVSIVGMSIYLYFDCETLLDVILTAILVLIGSTWMLDASVGNSKLKAISFFYKLNYQLINIRL